MVTEFQAELVSTDLIDGIWTVAFADAAQEKYLLIQRDVEKVLGDAEPDTHYVELDDQLNGCYGGVESVRVSSNQVIFRFSAAAAERMGTAEIQVSFNLSERDHAALSGALTKIIEHGNVAIF